MRRARFDQYEFPTFRLILSNIAVRFALIVTTIGFLTSLFNNYVIYSIRFGILSCYELYLIYKLASKNKISHQTRRDKAAIGVFNSVKSSDYGQKFSVFFAAILYDG
jgi:hypothetical protein